MSSAFCHGISGMGHFIAKILKLLSKPLHGLGIIFVQNFSIKDIVECCRRNFELDFLVALHFVTS